MSDSIHVGDLEIHQDLRHERREWTLERAGWVSLVVILLAALGGLLGPGPLSRATMGHETDLHVRYNRLVRYQSPETLRVRVGPAESRPVRIRLNREFVESVDLTRIDPEPEKVETGPDDFEYVFHSSNQQAAVTLLFHYHPSEFGRVPIRVGIANGREIKFTQFVFP